MALSKRMVRILLTTRCRSSADSTATVTHASSASPSVLRPRTRLARGDTVIFTESDSKDSKITM